jgi:two-component system, OmpR family, phosphate regulon sensor histidine kinase PhoR
MNSAKSKKMDRSHQIKNILETLVDGVVVLDEDGRVEYTNKQACLLLGKPQKSLVNKPFSIKNFVFTTLDNNPLTDAQLPLQQLRKDKDSVVNVEYLLHKSQEDPISISITASSLVDDEGSVSGIVMVLRDVTAAKESELQMMRFIDVIGHELKHPLSSIKAYSYFLRKYAVLSKQKNKIEVYLEKTDQQVDVLTQMLNDLLDISKINVRRFTIHTEEHEISHLVETIVMELQPVFPQHHLLFNSQRKAKVAVDAIRLRQVLMNLISNAAKYSPNADTIIVSVVVKKTVVEIKVIDFGVGIPPNEITQVFNPYFRASNSLKKKIKGLGLGLYLSSQIVKRHHGRLRMESELRKGSTVTITLPLKK